MNQKHRRYGERGQKTILLVFLLLICTSGAAATDGPVFSTEMVVASDGTVVVEQLEVVEGSPTRDERGNYHSGIPGLETHETWQDPHYLVVQGETTIQDIFSNGADVHDIQQVSLQFHNWDPLLEDDEEIIETQQVFRRLDYHPDAEYIHLMRGTDESIHRIHIPSRICVDDGTCSPYCEGRGIDPDCDDYRPYIGVAVAIFIAGLAMLVSAYVLQRRKPEDEGSSLPFWRITTA